MSDSFSVGCFKNFEKQFSLFRNCFSVNFVCIVLL